MITIRSWVRNLTRPAEMIRAVSFLNLYPISTTHTCGLDPQTGTGLEWRRGGVLEFDDASTCAIRHLSGVTPGHRDGDPLHGTSRTALRAEPLALH
jgi:hypothetical protein